MNLLRLVMIPFSWAGLKYQCATAFLWPYPPSWYQREKANFCSSFFGEQAKSLFYKGVETFFRRKVRLIAGYARPKQGRCVGGVMTWLALHKCELWPHIIFNVFEFVPVVTPCHDITMASHGDKPLWMCFVQIFLYQDLLIWLARLYLERECILRAIFSNCFRFSVWSSMKMSSRSGHYCSLPL